MRIVRRLAWPLGAALAIPVMAAPMPAAAVDTALPSAVEGFAYPDAAKILADRHITLKTGDGHITLAECASGAGQIHLFSRQAAPEEVCFKVSGPTGYLAVEIPKVYTIRGDGEHTVKAIVSTDGNTTTIDVPKDVWTAVGESGSSRNASTLLELTATDGPAVPSPSGDFPAVGTVTVDQPGRNPNAKACTATLVDRNWVLTAASCFGDKPAAGAPAAKSTATIGGRTVDIAELAPRTDRDLVMARLAITVNDITPASVGVTAPTAAENLRVAGYGRTATEWAPLKAHTTTHTVSALTTTTIDTTPAVGQAPICQGDAGAPLLRNKNGATEIAAVASRSWQGGCLGTPATETRTNATGVRVDDLAGWVQQTRAKAVGWKTQALVRSDNNLYFATRLYDGSWTPYEDVQAAAGNIGGVRAVATAGINTSTHIVALGGDGHLHYAIRDLDGGWGQKFVDVNTTVSDLGNISQVSVSPVGGDLHVVVVADGFLFHSVRYSTGQWTSFKVVTDVTGPLNGITSISAAGAADGGLHIAAVSGGTVYHTLRNAGGGWSTWGSVAEAAGATAPVTAVAISRQNSDLNLALIASDGQYHTLRWANGSWQPIASLSSVIGNITGTSISAAPVDTDAQFAIATSDNKVLLTARHSDGTWSTPETLDLAAIPGNHTGTMITSTL
ncbi:trypsin-like serine protease [Kitasatospora sp. NPDC058048]|uniref:trypsin-like serine protease n=1 Tax=Kitasatospora sp. NPDC058048 TaxID=3346313 RepID=UPI0036D7A8C5